MHDVLFVVAGPTVPAAVLSSLVRLDVPSLAVESVQEAVDRAADLSPCVIVLVAGTLDDATVDAGARLRAAFGTRTPAMVLLAELDGSAIGPKGGTFDAALPLSSSSSLLARRIVLLSAQFLDKVTLRVGTAPVDDLLPPVDGDRRRSPDLCRAVYASRSLIASGSAGNRAVLADIIESSRRRNQANGLTGALVHAAGYFVQALEGPPSAVEALLERIRVDTRHFDMRIRHMVNAEKRVFGAWSMVGTHLDLGDPLGASERFAPFDADPVDLTAFLHIAVTAQSIPTSEDGDGI